MTMMLNIYLMKRFGSSQSESELIKSINDISLSAYKALGLLWLGKSRYSTRQKWYFM